MTERDYIGADWVVEMEFEAVKQKKTYIPHNIVTEIQRQFGAKIGYRTALRARKICNKNISLYSAPKYA